MLTCQQHQKQLIFKENKVLFGPGKAANAGGVAVSGLEMTQNRMGYQWTRDELEDKLKIS